MADRAPQNEELGLSANAVKVLEARYLARDEQGRVVESPAGMFRRVAAAIAAAEERWPTSAGRRAETEERFLRLMESLAFIPNSPTLMNAGLPLGQLSACFVLPIEDSLPSIFESLKRMAMIHQSGGGTGFSFSRLRPNGDVVRSTSGVASGPVSFMRVYDAATQVIKQGGKRRGANMAILSVDHPDVEEFIEAKSAEGSLANFNLSVAAPDAFMEAVRSDGEYPLVNPRTGREVRRVRAAALFERLCQAAWRTGDPGLVFIDAVNRANPTPQVGRIESTNPCGEVPLLPYESCNLGSINLARLLRADGAKADIDWERLRETVRLAVRFLDNVIEVNRYPFEEIRAMTQANRKIGLGVMGLADALAELGIPYDTDEALAVAGRVMGFIQREARQASAALAQERGPFPNFKGSVFDRPGAAPLRNATATSIAPTGTISIIAGCSSGIEPLFALSYVRQAMNGVQLLEVNRAFERVARRDGFYSDALVQAIAERGSARGMREVPPAAQRAFVTDFDIAPEWHVRMQSVFQKHTDNAVSKTVNLPAEATVEDVRRIYWLAYALDCKGITVYRYGSKAQQVLYLGGTVRPHDEETVGRVTAHPEYAGGCPGGTVCQI